MCESVFQLQTVPLGMKNTSPSLKVCAVPPSSVIVTLPAPPLLKANTQATASVGERFRYRITVPETPHPFDLHDVQITDDLTASAADLRFVDVTKVSGSGAWTPVNTGSPTNIVIEDTTVGSDIPAGEQVVVEITVVLPVTANQESLDETIRIGETYADGADYIIAMTGTEPNRLAAEDWEGSYAAKAMGYLGAIELEIPYASPALVATWSWYAPCAQPRSCEEIFQLSRGRSTSMPRGLVLYSHTRSPGFSEV